MGNQDPTLANQMILGVLGNLWASNIADALRSTYGFPFPVMAFKPANRKLVHFAYSWTTAATPVSQQVYTVPSNKVLMIVSYAVSRSTSGGVGLRDGTADGGNRFINIHATQGGHSGMYCGENYPIPVRSGIRADAADLNGSVNYRFNAVGWLEDLQTADIATNVSA